MTLTRRATLGAAMVLHAAAYSVNFACAYRKTVTGVKTHPMRWFDLRQADLA